MDMIIQHMMDAEVNNQRKYWQDIKACYEGRCTFLSHFSEEDINQATEYVEEEYASEPRRRRNRLNQEAAIEEALVEGFSDGPGGICQNTRHLYRAQQAMNVYASRRYVGRRINLNDVSRGHPEVILGSNLTSDRFSNLTSASPRSLHPKQSRAKSQD